MNSVLRLVFILISLGVAGACAATSVDPSPDRLSEGSASVDPKKIEASKPALADADLIEQCKKWMKKIPGAMSDTDLDKICQPVKKLDACTSAEGAPIFHFDRPTASPRPERILTFALIHGDEFPSGAVARGWMKRLMEIEPRNAWRVIPILNPDGFERKTRTNARGVDLNRNFPSKDWNGLAVKYWETRAQSDPRRFPGSMAASEPETQCSMAHIKDFNPDLVIAVHTPYGVLDFDGPRLNLPAFRGLPWVSLGTFPGSLGRYMWTDQNKPVLTIELKHDLAAVLDRFDQLQDVTGQVAQQIKKTRRE